MENSLIKKEYNITEEGLLQFREWIRIPMNIHKVKNMEEGKFFFLGMVPKHIRIKSITGYIEDLMMEQEKLLKIKKSIKNLRDIVIKTNVDRVKEDDQLLKIY